MKVCTHRHIKYPGHSVKSAGDTVNWCIAIAVWCTQNMHRDGSSFTWHQVLGAGDCKLVHSCMVYTGRVPRQRQFHMAPAM